MSPEERSIRKKLGEPGNPLPDRDGELERLRGENADLRTIIEELLRRLYGRRSEKVARQEEKPAATPTESAAPAAAEPPVPKPGHGRAPFAKELPRETVINDVPEAERRCEICGVELVAIGEDVCERGHIEPVRIIVKRFVSKKYACPSGHTVKTAEGAPAGLVDRAKWSTATYGFVAVAKFGDHMPLERIESSLERQGIVLPKSTMAEMVETVGDKVVPILEQAKKEILADDHLQADETPIDVMVEGQKGTKSGYLWAWRAGEKVLFDFDFSRGQDIPKRFLGSWKGTLQTDGYSGYDAVVRANGINHAGCWTHARRKWKEAFDLGSKDAQGMLDVMRRLWQLEAAVKARVSARKLSSEEAEGLLARVRTERSRKVVGRVRKLRDSLIGRSDIAPKSPLGKAIKYLTNQWPKLLLFLDDPKIEIDTNGIERQMRSVAMGRKNWYVAGSAKGAVTAARLFSIINMCKAIGIDPHAYLTDVLERVSPHADLQALTPWAWAAARDSPPPTS
jgi:transposase